MENTSYNKQKFFALYWGQKIVADGLCPGDLCTVDFALSEGIVKEGWLELKPLSAISDEEFISLANIFGKAKIGGVFKRRNDCIEFVSLEYFKLYFNGDIYDSNDPLEENESRFFLEAYDFLRSKSYALPYMSLSVEQQIEYGWVKLTYNN